jgi:hypothetical protein
MRRLTLFLTVVLCAVCFSDSASSQATLPGVTFTNVSTGSGTITASGTFDAGNGNTGYEVKLTVIGPAGNCQKYMGQYGVPGCPPPQKGQWLIQISNLPPGSYTVSAVLKYQNAGGGFGTSQSQNAPNNPYTVN